MTFWLCGFAQSIHRLMKLLPHELPLSLDQSTSTVKKVKIEIKKNCKCMRINLQVNITESQPRCWRWKVTLGKHCWDDEDDRRDYDIDSIKYCNCYKIDHLSALEETSRVINILKIYNDNM